jgi:hypothetical protein
VFYTGRSDLIEVTRVDKKNSITRSWRGNAVQDFVVSPESEASLVYDMKKGSRLIVRTEDRTGGLMTYFFGLSGVTDGMAQMPCNPNERPSGTDGRSLTERERASKYLEKKMEGLFE